ncbi:MAG: hypothetical protein ACO3FA_00820 [Vulcanococcus sp.]|jgi:hypothetical protein
MGFVLQQSPSFTWPITIRERQDGGRYRTHTFDAVFRRLPQSRQEEIQLAYQRLKSEVARDLVIDTLPTRQIAAEILVGWSGIFEEDGTTQVPYSEDVKAQLLEVEGVADVLVSTYIESGEKAKAKN